jgi:hypothetical protein
MLDSKAVATSSGVGIQYSDGVFDEEQPRIRESRMQRRGEMGAFLLSFDDISCRTIFKELPTRMRGKRRRTELISMKCLD